MPKYLYHYTSVEVLALFDGHRIRHFATLDRIFRAIDVMPTVAEQRRKI
jgi:hypothetical protein